MKEKCRKEVIELHAFFEQWFKAEIENTDNNFKRFSETINQKFLLIVPTGEKINREKIIKQIREGYGSHKEDEKPYKLWVKNIETKKIGENLFVTTYEEWGEIKGVKNARVSSAIFKENSKNPNDLEWLHVHETAIPVE